MARSSTLDLQVQNKGGKRALTFEVLVEPGHGLGPCISRRLGPIAGPGITVEAMSATRIGMEFVDLVIFGQLGIHLGHIFRRWVLVIFTKQPQHRHAYLRRLIEGRRAVT